MIKKYTHLFFDLDNTLWDFEQNSKIALEKTLSHFKLQEKGIAFEIFYDAYSSHNKYLWNEYRNGKVVKKELKRLRFEQTFKELGINGIDALEMNLFYLTEMPFQTNLVEGAVELLDYLTTKSYRLFIITNGFREIQLQKLEKSGLKKYFTKVYISEDIKAPKPSRKIFEYAIKSSNAKKETSLMIGDDFETDIVGAAQFGINAVWLDASANGFPGSRIKKDRINTQIYSIHLLNELNNML
jgi:putative hydrolase of the HAD superfamily